MNSACVFNIGSINEDRVYRVQRIARPGETVASSRFEVFPGGKGANQSVALARAGMRVRHVGKIGNDGQWLRALLEKEGIDTSHIARDDSPTGHANIQVDESGENSIVLFGGTNRQLTVEQLTRALGDASGGDALLVQNEVNLVPEAIEAGHRAGMQIYFNPAPMDMSVSGYPLERVDGFFLNAGEAAALTREGASPDRAMTELMQRFPNALIIITLGAEGALYGQSGSTGRVESSRVNAVDTTAAGDTFIGFCLAGLLEGKTSEEAVRLGCRAAALAVTVAGAMSSIPQRQDVAQ